MFRVGDRVVFNSPEDGYRGKTGIITHISQQAGSIYPFEIELDEVRSASEINNSIVVADYELDFIEVELLCFV